MNRLREYLLLFFERATEPCFLPKGLLRVVFKLPARFYPPYYQPILKAIEKQIPQDVKDIIVELQDIVLPDLSLPLRLPKDGQFSVFVPEHQKMARRLVEVLMAAPSDHLLALCAYCQLRMNPYLFIYCLSIAILHRPDTKGLDVPTFAETFPDKFVDRETLNRAREMSFVIPKGFECPVIDIDIAIPKIPEQRVSYFREDIGLNSHHWHWHLIYPGNLTEGSIVDKDRRGELFYYMHHQIIARYNVERMCNGLERTKILKDFKEQIPEGCFPILDSKNASRAWAIRFDNVPLHDLDRPDDQLHVSISDLDLWRDRILEAIDRMAYLNEKTGQFEPLDEVTGIDILGNIIEATILSVNPDYYGSYHNQGHNIISFAHDPNGYHSEPNTVMGDTATAMRDPVFYRWHAYIDEIFTRYKNKLTPYGSDKLEFPDIVVSSVGLENTCGEATSTLNTLWGRSRMNLENGLDFLGHRKVYARVTYLQHEEFQYVIEIKNNNAALRTGTVRIFMAPTVDENGVKLSFDEQRQHMLEMDKFSHPLKPGNNIIRRSSTNSSVTIPFERILRDLSDKPEAELTSGNNYCDCGWPQNLLVPKGNGAGYPMVLLVMVSNWELDKVGLEQTGGANDNASYCGVRDQKYPDKQPMGFPFDRKLAPGVVSMDKFLTPNMAYANCTIKFTDVIKDRDSSTAGVKKDDTEPKGCKCSPDKSSEEIGEVKPQ